MFKPLIAISLAGAAAAAGAQDVPPPDIVVTGTGLEAPPGEAAYDVATIGPDRLANTASGRLEDALRDVAGFAQFRRSDARSAHPTSQGATLRGLGGNASSRALVLLDGVPQVDPFGGWVNFAALDPVRLGLVRVTRGGGSGIYGAGALAGTVELISAPPLTETAGWGALAYGSRDSLDGDAGFSGPIAGGGSISVSGAYARGDGFTPIVRGDRGVVDRAAPYRQGSVAARMVVPIGPEVELQAAGLGFHDARERGTAFTGNTSDGLDASLRLVARGRWGVEALGYLQARRFASDFASVDATRSTVTQSLEQFSVPATGLGGRIELRPPLGEAITLRLGADARRLSGRTRENYSFVAGAATRARAAGGQTLTLGAFADASVDVADRLTLTAGGRIDRWRITDGFLHESLRATGAAVTDEDFADRSGWRPTARGGVAFHPAQAVTIRGASYLGWRLPALNELYRPFRAGLDATAANPGLAPERLRGVDGGIDYQPFHAVRFSATAFWNRLDDAIANVTNPRDAAGNCPGIGFVSPAGACRIRRNLDAIRARGVELEGAIALGGWTADLSYALTDARVSATGASAALDGLRPAQTARQQASATVAWQPDERHRAALTLRYIGPQFEDDANSRLLGHAVTADAVLAWPLTGALGLQARVENIADKTVAAAVSSSGIVERASPRTLWIGLRFGR